MSAAELFKEIGEAGAKAQAARDLVWQLQSDLRNAEDDLRNAEHEVRAVRRRLERLLASEYGQQVATLAIGGDEVRP